MKRELEHAIARFWEKRTFVHRVLSPLSITFALIAKCRRFYYQRMKSAQLPVPVIVVGNITVGGTGKTPCVIALATALQQAGYTPGIITRGYKGRVSEQQAVVVDDTRSAHDVGDEALVLAHNTAMPVVAGKKRVDAAILLLEQFPMVNVIISDDGLQHYALARDVEIALVDGVRRYGNGLCLPLGPLREPVKRLQTVDFIVVNGAKAQEKEWTMSVTLSDEVYNVNHPNKTKALSNFNHQRVHAFAGIGYPERFFNVLAQYPIDVIKHPFPDHVEFCKHDFQLKDSYSILMTEKDAVKCQTIAPENAWFVRAKTALPDELINQIIRRLQNGQKITRHSSVSPLQTARHLQERK